jgi:hypothetical protein
MIYLFIIPGFFLPGGRFSEAVKIGVDDERGGLLEERARRSGLNSG